MFFSCATRPTYVISGRSSDEPHQLAEARTIACEESISGQPGRQNVDRRLHAVLQQHITHRFGRCDQRIHIATLGAGETLGDEPPDTPRQHRHVVMQILLEERVVRSHARDAGTACEPHTRIVRDERRVDVHQIEVVAPQPAECLLESTPAHAPIFRVAGNATARNANDVLAQVVSEIRRLGRVAEATSVVSTPQFARSSRKVRMEVETPLTRGK